MFHPLQFFAVVTCCQTIGLSPILCKHCLFSDLLCTSLAKTLLAILPGNNRAGARLLPGCLLYTILYTIEYGKMVLKTIKDNVPSNTFSVPQFSDEIYAVIGVLVDADVDLFDMFVEVAVDVSADCLCLWMMYMCTTMWMSSW